MRDVPARGGSSRLAIAVFARRNVEACARRLPVAVALVIFVAWGAVLSGCALDPEPVPTSTPTPEPAPNPFLVPGTTEVRYTDGQLGFAFSHPNDWNVYDPDVAEGVVITVTSPDGFVNIDILRDMPPPQIDTFAYGQARMEFLRLAEPAVTVEEDEMSALRDGTPVYRARWVSRAGDAETTGDLLVLIRGEGTDRDALIVVVSGPTALHSAWTGPRLLFFDTLTATYGG